MGNRSGALDPESLLGLVFAGSDMVFEIDDQGRIGLALGAVKSLTGVAPDALSGRGWEGLFAPDDHDLLNAVLAGIASGERIGPLRVTLAQATAAQTVHGASLSVFRLPGRAAPVLSCALSRGPVGAPAALNDRGLLPSREFDAVAAGLLQEAKAAGLSVRLDLVELLGLDEALASLSPDEALSVRRQVAAAFRADTFAGVGAAEVATDRFALVRSAAVSPERIHDRLHEILGDAAKPVTVPLALTGRSEAQNLRAMRYALDRYIEDGATAAAKSFSAVVKRTLDEAGRFKAMMAKDALELAYQPVVALDSLALHHYEALARFDGDTSPGETIKMAEDLGMIADFDMIVVRSVAQALSRAPDLKIAANLSAHSIERPAFVAELLLITDKVPENRARLLLEITETQALQDLDRANIVIQELRKAGHAVCLDDFGAGAASLEYLRRLDVDFVKIDGRYIQALTASSRDELIVKHVVALCRDMGVTTIVEMVETAQSEQIARALGAHLGQGWRFGKPTGAPNYRPPAAPARGRRAGASEQWS